MKILIVVTHLLGTGHLARALTLARAFGAAGHCVRVASGGMPAPHLERGDIDLAQLPPIRSDGVDFTRLLDETGAVASPTMLTARATALVALLREYAPDVLITELFPFGRRILRTEFEALLSAARELPRRPLICASIRDILAPPSKPEKAAKTDAVLAAYYDRVLVHSDASVTPLDISWPVSDTLAARLSYTGFVAPAPAGPHPDHLGADEIIVSAGGGDVGDALFDTAVRAAYSSMHQWRLLIGGQNSATRMAKLQPRAAANVTIEPARPEFRQMLHHAAASVSMCGYNTALDLLQTGCRALLVPFDAGSEVEQSLRATALTALPGFASIRTAELTPERLLIQLDALLKGPARPPQTTGLDGAAKTVDIVQQLRDEMP